MCGAQLGRIDGLAFALVESNLNGLSAGGGSAGGGFAGGRDQPTPTYGMLGMGMPSLVDYKEPGSSLCNHGEWTGDRIQVFGIYKSI